MTRNRMLVELGVGLAMLSVLAVFGRHQLSRLPDELMRAGRSAIDRVDRATLDSPASQQRTAVASAPDVMRPPAAASPSARVNLPHHEDPRRVDLSDASSAPPDPQAVRDSAAAEVAALEPLHDELIEVLAAIHEAQTDREAKRRADQAVTMAGIAKRHDLQQLEPDAAAEADWRVAGARRGAARAKARLKRQIDEARETLARIRGR